MNNANPALYQDMLQVLKECQAILDAHAHANEHGFVKETRQVAESEIEIKIKSVIARAESGW
jgi:hypothetical protein